MQSPDVLPQPPAPPQLPQAQLPNGQVIDLPQGSPGEVYQGAVARRDALREARDAVQEARDQISGQLQDPMVNGANRAGLETRIAQLDQRLIQFDQQIAQAEAQVAQAAMVPGATHMPQPGPFHDGPPNVAFVIPVVFIVFVLGPLSVAAAIRLLRRGGKAVAAAATPQWLQERFGRLEQSVDAMAVEVERISEGQRFLTRVFAENNGNRALGQGAAQPIEVGARESAAAQPQSSSTSRGPVR